MRNPSIAVRVVLLVSAAAACQGRPPAAGFSEADRAAVRKTVIDDAVAALGARNFAAFADTYTADAAYLPPNAPGLKGRDAMLSFLNNFPPYTDFKASAVSIDGSGDVAFVHGTFSMMVTP